MILGKRGRKGGHEREDGGIRSRRQWGAQTGHGFASRWSRGAEKEIDRERVGWTTRGEGFVAGERVRYQ